MKVYEFLEVCPNDHEITFRFNTTQREVYLPNKSHLYDKNKGILFKELNEEIKGVFADDFKHFYILTK